MEQPTAYRLDWSVFIGLVGYRVVVEHDGDVLWSTCQADDFTRWEPVAPSGVTGVIPLQLRRAVGLLVGFLDA